MRHPAPPTYPKSPILRPQRAAVPSRSRSDPSHIQGISPGPSQPSTAISNGEPFPPIPVGSTPPPQENLAPYNNRASSILANRSALPSIFHNASSSISIHSQNEVDKDAIIARLSTSNAQLEADFVTELSHLSTKFAETAEELEELKETHKGLQDSWEGLSCDFANYRDQNTYLRSELARKEDQEREDKTRITSLLIERSTLLSHLSAARATSVDRDTEVETLRTQVRGLKTWVSTSSRSEGQVTDEVLRTAISDLAAGLQNWVLKNYRRSKLLPISDLSEEVKEKLDEVCPMWESLISHGTAKVHLLQSFVSRVLKDRVFETYFVGLPEEQEEQLRSFEAWLRATAKNKADLNSWRAATLGALNTNSMAGDLEWRTEQVIHAVGKEVMDLLGVVTTTEAPSAESMSSQLHALIKEAITLSRTLRVQKALFTLWMPIIRQHELHHFDAETMEDIGGEDEESLQGREVLCITFPGVMKEGDENGERMELRNCIAKAKGLCGDD